MIGGGSLKPELLQLRKSFSLEKRERQQMPKKPLRLVTDRETRKKLNLGNPLSQSPEEGPKKL
jgi:hypothetical protein